MINYKMSNNCGFIGMRGPVGLEGPQGDKGEEGTADRMQYVAAIRSTSLELMNRSNDALEIILIDLFAMILLGIAAKRGAVIMSMGMISDDFILDCQRTVSKRGIEIIKTLPIPTDEILKDIAIIENALKTETEPVLTQEGNYLHIMNDIFFAPCTIL